jgi:hypothetical protein
MKTLKDLQEEVWSGIPYIKRKLIGRERVDDLVMLAVEQCPLDLCQHFEPGSKECDVVCAAWSESARRSYCLLYGGDENTFGPLFWILVSPVMSYIMQRILEWYFETKSHRATLRRWKRELTK